ncbi:Hypothetical predicted protein [Paramuricea clavata]|uniref:Uncharacterized protein n=1 Tax=Paramuricea clavata TaxID=317549 RepID=A0A7D9H9B3_PARCT|nr:Hypothetical predicted protein [Paramuricea clavata]
MQEIRSASARSENDSGMDSPVMQWQRISKRVGFQKNWTKECIIKVLNDSEGETLQGKDLQRIPFNANLYKACVQSGRLSDRAKHLFTKDPDVRTSKDIKEIFRAVDKLQCFSKYSRAVKQGLAKFVYYSDYPPDRVVVQQGHPALSFYFILQGSVNIVVDEINTITGIMTKNVVGEILAGNSFGELALIHDTYRRASVICKEQSEFLRLDKSDFNQVLRETYEKEWSLRMGYLRAIPAFKSWSKLELKAANNASKIVDYPDNTVAFKEEAEPSETIYIIKAGRCILVKKMSIIKKTLPFGREKLVLPPEKDGKQRLSRLKENETMLTIFLTIKTLKSGDYFGVGESMKDSFIITRGKTELMLIPRSILQIHNRGKVLRDMKDALIENNWKREDIFKAYIRTREWDQYKQAKATNVVSRKPKLRTTTTNDIPIHVREENPNYFS